MPRTTRRKLATGIYADNHGFAVVVSYQGQRREQRVKKGASRSKLREERAKLLHTLQQQATAHGSFKADALAYLATLPEGKMRENRTRECAAWYPEFGRLPRAAITPALCVQGLDRMPLSASSKKKCLTALKAVWRCHDGRHAPTPADHIRRPRETRDVRGMPQAVVTMILRQLPPSKTRARLKVLARTGLPHAQIAALQPHHLDIEAREITVTPRRKGHGVAARTLPITHKAVRAFKEFQRMQAWGTFSRHSMRRMFTEAVQRAKAAWKGRWPAADTLRPYDLRHAFATELYKRTRDLRATAELLLHADMTMTARYAEAAVSHTAQAARDAMDSATRSATKQAESSPVSQSRKASRAPRKRGTSRAKTAHLRKK